METILARDKTLTRRDAAEPAKPEHARDRVVAAKVTNLPVRATIQKAFVSPSTPVHPASPLDRPTTCPRLPFRFRHDSRTCPPVSRSIAERDDGHESSRFHF